MSDKSVVQVDVKNVLPTKGGTAIFLGNDEKCFIIYVDNFVGAAINMIFKGTPRPRPNTHDLFFDVLMAFGGNVERLIINDFSDTVFFSRLIVTAENELLERKIIEVDGRPSDGIALALLFEAPIYVATEVWEAVEDMTNVLGKFQDTNDEDSSF